MSSPAETRIAEALATGADELNLADTGLTELPASLRALTGLTRLDLSYNRLRELPPWIGELDRLTELDLNYNGLERVPAPVASLTALRGLGLLGNRLTDLPAALAGLRDLRWMVLRGNTLTRLPGVLSELTALELLDVRHNTLTAVPDWIGDLTALRHLDLGDTGVTTAPARLAALTELRQLDLRDNRLTELPAELHRLDRLGSLWLSGNRFTSLPEPVRGLTGLTSLALRNNRLTTLPGWICDLTGLTSLALGGNELAGLPPDLGRLSALTELDLANNRLTDLPDDLGALGLTLLDLAGNPLTAELQAAYRNGPDELLGYLRLRREDSRFVREAKLILVGEGDVGKSCLLGALRGEPWQSRPTTHGIEIKTLEVAGDAPAIQLNGWDFSGQPQYRATHQLFFSAPAIYLVVWKPRVGAERSYVKYWIDLIVHRVGPSARILVVATHGGPGEPGAFLDEAQIRALYGEVIVDFHHVDSKTGDRIDELRRAIASAAASLPGVGRWHPKEWLEFRNEIKQLREPYLLYSDYEQRAKLAGLEDSAAMLARIADRLGHWVTFADDENEDGPAKLVILQPDWLSTAVSLILDDRETYEAHGLLPHRRLNRIWGDRGSKHFYERRFYPAFLALMERFELSYQVTDRSARNEPTSLIGLRVPTARPDLREVWTDYRPDWEVAARICEVTETGTRHPGLPEGLMCQLIVHFHRYSLGRADVRGSVHWRDGMVLEDSYTGRALIEQEQNLLRVTVRSPSPSLMLYRLTEDIRELINATWQGFDVAVQVSCRACPSGSFDQGMLMRARATTDAVLCTTCGRPHRIDDLLLTGRESPRTPGPWLPSELRHVVRTELEPLARQIEDFGPRTEAQVLASAEHVLTRLLVARDQLVDDIVGPMDDETRNGPWLASIERIDRSMLKPGVLNVNLRLVLWCEHARLPICVVRDDPEAGVYEISMPRQWLVQAAPYLKVGLTFLRTFVPLVPDGLGDLLSEAGRTALSEQLKAVGDSLEPVLDEADSFRGQEPVRGAAERPDALALRMMQGLIRAQDPAFAGLVQVRVPGRGTHRYRWVDPRFENEYRQRTPTVPPES
ncbi:COR domain-containing protein [Actinoplanes solisilvae]|uniref:leucine-rich repeat domain-containing protein n=1 Tax=Actinoplanes solisilvae TaxID=2486853 RepID=UPI000FDBBA73|nr:COR domain-containing protein [Actinoplanes solisilvae]